MQLLQYSLFCSLVARFQHVGRKFLRLGMNKELKQMTEFCQVSKVRMSLVHHVTKCMHATSRDVIVCVRAQRM